MGTSGSFATPRRLGTGPGLRRILCATYYWPAASDALPRSPKNRSLLTTARITPQESRGAPDPTLSRAESLVALLLPSKRGLMLGMAQRAAEVFDAYAPAPTVDVGQACRRSMLLHFGAAGWGFESLQVWSRTHLRARLLLTLGLESIPWGFQTNPLNRFLRHGDLSAYRAQQSQCRRYWQSSAPVIWGGTNQPEWQLLRAVPSETR